MGSCGKGRHQGDGWHPHLHGGPRGGPENVWTAWQKPVAAGGGLEAADEDWGAVPEVSGTGRVGWEVFGSGFGSAWSFEEKWSPLCGIRWVLAAW